MKIAVIGGNGFIGKEFVGYAAENGHTTAVIGSDCDVFSKEGEKKAAKVLENCDAMVFLAARRINKDFSFRDYAYNVELFDRYIEIARNYSVANIVTASSISVYSSDSIPWKENESDIPLSLYGASKSAIDSLALLYSRQYGLKIKSLRLAQVIGMAERKGYLLNTLIDNAIAGKEQTIFGRGIGRRQYIYVKDVCDAILHCLVNKINSDGIFNIGMDHSISITDLAGIINDVFENTAGIRMLEDKPEDTKEYLMDVTKAKTVLEWTPGYGIREALEDIKDTVRV